MNWGPGRWRVLEGARSGQPGEVEALPLDQASAICQGTLGVPCGFGGLENVEVGALHLQRALPLPASSPSISLVLPFPLLSPLSHPLESQGFMLSVRWGDS